MLRDHVIYSIKHLRDKGLRSWLTMIGIFIGIAAVVSLIGLGEGLRNAISSQFGFLGPDVLSVQASGLAFAGPPGTGVVKPLTDDLSEKIKKLNGVATSFNRYIKSVPVQFNEHQIIGFMASVPEGEDRKTFEAMVNLKADKGRLLKDSDSKNVVLGNDFKKDNTFGKGVNVGDKLLLNGTTFQVVGILEKKGSFIFDTVVLVNEKTMFNDLGVDKKNVNVIAVKVNDVKIVNDIKVTIEKFMRKERNVKKGEEDFQVLSPQQTLQTLNSAVFAVQLFVYVIAFISIIVGGIGIMNTMYTSVLERTKEIGIMKSIGAKNSTIFTIFFVESGLLGVVGGVIGVVLGLAFAFGLSAAGRIYLGSDLIQAKIPAFVIFGSLIGSFVLGTFFGVLPAYQASKLSPVESLRSAK